MGKIRILIVEDEDLHAEKIKFYIDNLGYTLAGQAADAGEGYRLFQATKPDIILLDINLERSKDGVQLANQIRMESSVPIIFITSLNDHETIDRAKEAEPEAYLLKPLQEAGLQAAIEIALQRNSRKELAKGIDTGQTEWNQDVMIQDSIFVKVGKVIKKIDNQEVSYIQTAGDKHCDIVTEDQSYSIRSSLSALEERLPPSDFFRIHRAYMINISKIEEINESEMKVKVGSELLPIGRSFKPALFEKLNYLG